MRANFDRPGWASALLGVGAVPPELSAVLDLDQGGEEVVRLAPGAFGPRKSGLSRQGLDQGDEATRAEPFSEPAGSEVKAVEAEEVGVELAPVPFEDGGEPEDFPDSVLSGS